MLHTKSNNNFNNRTTLDHDPEFDIAQSSQLAARDILNNLLIYLGLTYLLTYLPTNSQAKWHQSTQPLATIDLTCHQRPTSQELQTGICSNIGILELCSVQK